MDDVDNGMVGTLVNIVTTQQHTLARCALGRYLWRRLK